MLYWFYINRSPEKDNDTKKEIIINRYGLKKHIPGQIDSKGNKTSDINLIPDEKGKLRLTPGNISPTSLAVLVQKDVIQLYINGKLVDEVVDDDINSSSVGIGTIVCQWLPKGSFKFDKFQVQSPLLNMNGSQSFGTP
jgi:hypothetical protein